MLAPFKVYNIYVFLSLFVKCFMSRRLSDDFYESFHESFHESVFKELIFHELIQSSGCAGDVVRFSSHRFLRQESAYHSRIQQVWTRPHPENAKVAFIFYPYNYTNFVAHAKVSLIILSCSSIHRKTAPLIGQSLCCVLRNLF